MPSVSASGAILSPGSISQAAKRCAMHARRCSCVGSASRSLSFASTSAIGSIEAPFPS